MGICNGRAGGRELIETRGIVVSVVVGLLLAVTSAATVFAAPIYCPGVLYSAHDGGDWYCASPSGNPTGAGWHNGTDEKL